MNLHATALLALSASALLAAGNFVGTAPLVVSNVAVSRDPATHLLRVSYDLSNEADEPAYVTLDVQTNGVSIGWDKFRTLSGDVTSLSAPSPSPAARAGSLSGTPPPTGPATWATTRLCA